MLTYHVVPGKLTAKDLEEQIKAGGGKAELKTVQGEPLTAEKKGGHIVVVDSKGDAATVTIPNVIQSNGVIHVVSSVALPK